MVPRDGIEIFHVGLDINSYCVIEVLASPYPYPYPAEYPGTWQYDARLGNLTADAG